MFIDFHIITYNLPHLRLRTVRNRLDSLTLPVPHFLQHYARRHNQEQHCNAAGGLYTWRQLRDGPHLGTAQQTARICL
ncbi:unnamed protein product [Chondrus crispus]|uniref:Uncharacterized protein n=1 Tax=Chondrus crispus TaxID=2769 RepID=R7QJU7_CHOCR|nr:unnamed protein product [Chondrus crispus]CDF38364.1 unnamed protein product [Chondrus crispus]|eukprot:XP_005718249.1 unnamed protein product [Chondrus crispus]